MYIKGLKPNEIKALVERADIEIAGIDCWVELTPAKIKTLITPADGFTMVLGFEKPLSEYTECIQSVDKKTYLCRVGWESINDNSPVNYNEIKAFAKKFGIANFRYERDFVKYPQVMPA